MADETPTAGSSSENPAETSTAAEPAPQPDAAAVEGGAAEALAQALGERDDLRDRLLRLAADMDNARRRAERELADARSYAIAKFAGDMLTVADNFERALASIPAEQRTSAEGPFKALIEGAELVERDMLRALERHGVKKIDPKGERFDPHFHQAIFELPDPSVPNGTVAQVVQVGYVIGERVLRPAMVGVARGGAKAETRTEGEAVDRTA